MTLAVSLRPSTSLLPPFRVSPESAVLALVCLLDLATTLFWVSYREAAEGNPIMAFYLQRGGATGFIIAKIILCAVPLFVTEWARQYRPNFVRTALRVGIAAYLTFYAFGVCQVNRDENSSTPYQAIAFIFSGDNQN